MSAITDPEQLLEKFKDKNLPATYILGGFATRVTFHSQQVRAFNLVYALYKKKKIKAGSKVCVIGGGLAGLTVAAAASIKGCEVTLYEEKDYLLGLQMGCKNRDVHPNIYDWPESGCESEITDLPCLNWSAGTAEEIRKTILVEWESDFSAIKTHVKHPVNFISKESGKPRVTINEPFVYDSFNCVIVATGFGTEKPLGSFLGKSYWKSDELDQQYISPGNLTSFLVSGCGDGGLIDALRLSIRDFSHENFTKNYLDDPSMVDIKHRLLEIEAEAFDDQENASAILWDAYGHIVFPPLLQAKLETEFRTDTKVTLNGNKATPMTLQSSLVNRVGVLMLMKLKKVGYMPAELVSVIQDGKKYKANLKKANGDVDIIEYDEVILRHGPEPVINKLVAKDSSLVNRSKKDPTTVKCWAKNFYPIKAIPGKLASPMETANEKKSELSNLLNGYAEINSVNINPFNGRPAYFVSINAPVIPVELQAINQFSGFPVYYNLDPGFSFAMGDIRNDFMRVAGGSAIYNVDSGDPGRSGTLGCFVELSNGRVGILSSYHVLGRGGKEGDQIGLKGGKTNLPTPIGRLYAFSKLRSLTESKHSPNDTRSNSIDAAVATLNAGVTFFPGLIDQQSRFNITGSGRASLHDEVYKVGAGTGLTRGKVTQVDSMVFLHVEGQRYRFDNCIMVESISTLPFSGKGDSGAIVLNDKHQVYGLIFATGENTTVICPIDEVLKALDCRLYVTDVENRN